MRSYQSLPSHLFLTDSQLPPTLALRSTSTSHCSALSVCESIIVPVCRIRQSSVPPALESVSYHDIVRVA